MSRSCDPLVEQYQYRLVRSTKDAGTTSKDLHYSCTDTIAVPTTSRPVVVLSYGFWRSYFDGDRKIVGRTIALNGHAMTIIGVAQPGFDGVELGAPAKVQVRRPLSRRHFSSPDAGRHSGSAVPPAAGRCRFFVRPCATSRAWGRFPTHHLLTFRIDPSLNGYSDEQSKSFYQRLDTNLQTMPGVTSVGFSSMPLLQGYAWQNAVLGRDFEGAPIEEQPVLSEVGPGYFATWVFLSSLGVPSPRRTWDRPNTLSSMRALPGNISPAQMAINSTSPWGEWERAVIRLAL
jgi:hypothetical protein